MIGQLPTIPQLPRIWLGFGEAYLPEFEITPALKRLAARQAQISLEKLEANPPELSERLLRACWQEQLLTPGSRDNPTDFYLMDAELCTQTSKALRIYEDFRRLVGAYTYNPVRKVEIFRLPNPAGEIWERFGFDLAAGGFNQPFPDDVIEQMERAMRQSLGDAQQAFNTEDIFDALTEPTSPVMAISVALPQLRSQLDPFWNDCVSDSNLRHAARRPEDGLHASGACRIQVFRRDPAAPIQFDATMLHRRMEVDWEPIHHPVEEAAASFPTTVPHLQPLPEETHAA